MSRTILVLNNDERDVLNIKYPLIKTLTQNIETIVFVVPPHQDVDPQDYAKKYPDKRVVVHHVSINLYSFNPLRDLGYLLEVYKLVKKYQPTEIFTMAVKPITAIGFSLLLNPLSTKAVALFSGLGRAFLTRGIFSRFKLLYARLILSLALKPFHKVIFQNQDNLDYFIAKKIILPEQGIKTNGTGVDLEIFRPAREIKKIKSVIMISRVLRSKGVLEYCHSARALENQYPEVNFYLAGPLENTADGISEDELSDLCDGVVTYKGFIKDVKSELALHDLFVLPTRYPEGVPRIILEAIAMGIPIITTNSAGCNETVENGENGFLLENGDPQEITQHIKTLLEKPDLLKEMSFKSRLLAEDKFNIIDVNRSLEMVFDGI